MKCPHSVKNKQGIPIQDDWKKKGAKGQQNMCGVSKSINTVLHNLHG